MPYQIVYFPDAEEHLRSFSAYERQIIVDNVTRQLSHQPTVDTRNRHPLRSNPLAAWELRIGKWRVYYDIREEPQKTVIILAVGVKERNRVLIGGMEAQL